MAFHFAIWVFRQLLTIELFKSWFHQQFMLRATVTANYDGPFDEHVWAWKRNALEEEVEKQLAMEKIKLAELREANLQLSRQNRRLMGVE